MKITNYTPQYKDAIKRLNYEWLEKYFEIEPIDVKVLSNPEEEIINKGGMIFYAWYNNEIVGTVSLLKREDNSFELTKMAVSEKHQGMGIGKKLMEHAIEQAKNNQAEKIIIYSNTKLNTAISLYEKYGFQSIPIDYNDYKRCNIMMEKILV